MGQSPLFFILLSSSSRSFVVVVFTSSSAIVVVRHRRLRSSSLSNLWRRNKVSLSLYPPGTSRFQNLGHKSANPKQADEGKAFGRIKTYPPWPTNDEKPVFGRKQPPETRNLAKSSQPSPYQPSPLRRNVPKICKSQKAQNPAETPKLGRLKIFSAAVGTHTSRKWLSLENIPSKFRD